MQLLCGSEPAMRKAILFSLVLLVFFASTKCGNLEKEKAKYLLLYILVPLFLIQLFGIMNSNYPQKAFNPSLILYMFILTWTFDTFAYLIGKTLGKNKIMPSISPKKSWEGFVGGLAFTLLAALLTSDFFQFDYVDFNPYILLHFYRLPLL